MNIATRMQQTWAGLSIPLKFAAAFGLLFALIIALAVTGYMTLSTVQRHTEDAIFSSTRIQYLVVNMQVELEQARRLERDFFLRYPKIGFALADQEYAPQVKAHIAKLGRINRELQQRINQSQVSVALQRSDVNLNFYMLSADRYATLFAEAVALVEDLAAEDTGAHAQLLRHATDLFAILEQSGDLDMLVLYHQMRTYEQEYWSTRQRPHMQSSFNVAATLQEHLAISASESAYARDALETLAQYLNIAEQILALDVAISSKTNEFDLQAEAIDPISEELLTLAGQEVVRARQRIRAINQRATLVMALTTAAGVLIVAMIAGILNLSITRNIVVLTAAANTLQAGHLQVFAAVSGSDELGRLANTFNAMSVRISSLVSNLEQAVAERTEELLQVNRQLEEEITERRHAEEAVQQLNQELEDRVRRRTFELEAANRELRNFAYVVSHDLKAPLRGISRLVAWMVEDYTDVIDAEGKKMADLLIGRVKRMDNLIEGILEYSRIGRVHGSLEDIDLHELVGDVIQSFGPLPHIQIRMKTTLPTITGDRVRLSQVFQNLLDNAVKFLENSDGRIEIDCANICPGLWTFSVADNGPGIPSQHFERIFQIFQTLQPRDVRESTGIGLALVKKIVELHGGAIWVESTVGTGSTFFFTIPKEFPAELLP